MSMIKKLSSTNLPWPTDWAQIFGTHRPLIVEIGFGDAQYLMHLGDKHPDCNIIGLEISNKSMEKAERRIEREARANVRAIHSPADTALYHMLEPQSVREFHVNYPDPWFKKRHEGRRLIKRETLDVIVNRLEPEGMFYLATDIVEYAEMASELLQETPGLTNRLDAPWKNQLPGRFTTKYEAKGLREGRIGNYFVYQRNENPAPQIPVYRDLEMPHIILQNPLEPAEMLQHFNDKLTEQRGDAYISILSAYVNNSGSVLMFEVNVTEPTIDQHVGLMLFKRQEPGAYILRLGPLGNPRPTDGLHRATAVLADWIVGLHPDAKILERKVRDV